MRALLRKTPFYGAYKRLGHYPDYWYWLIRGRPPRTPHLVKQRTVRRYAAEYGLRILIETGTYYGEMVAAMKNRVDRVYSIECDPALARRAERRFRAVQQVRIIEGDSQQAVPALLRELNQPALFWLDAGYYGWAELKGDRGRLAAELEAILAHRLAGHVVLLDDARGFNGENGAPTLADFIGRIERRFPDRELRVADDIVRITPRRGAR